MDDVKGMDRRKFLTVLGGGLGGALVLGGLTPASFSLAKEAFPANRITYIVGYAPGGGSDMIARAVAQFMVKQVKAIAANPAKVDVVIKNIPGGSGMKALRELYGADPDGYTIAHAGDELFVRSILGNLGFDLFSVTYLARISSGSKVLVTGKNSKLHTWDDVVKTSKQMPLTFGNAIFGSANHVGTILLVDTTGLSAKMVLMGNSPNTNAGLIRGDINLALNNQDTLQELIAAGELRPIVAFSEKSPYHGVPTIKEVGFPDLVDSIKSQRYVIAPPKLPANIKKSLVDVLKKTVADKEFNEWNKKVGLSFDPIFSPEAEAYTKKIYGFYKSKEQLLRRYLVKPAT